MHEKRLQKLTICCYFRLQQEREGSCDNVSTTIISTFSSLDRINVFTVVSVAHTWRNTVEEICLLRWKFFKDSDNLQKCTTKAIKEQMPANWLSSINKDRILLNRMWANAQRDGRPAIYRRRPLFNAAKFGWRPLPEYRAVTLPRRETTRWN